MTWLAMFSQTGSEICNLSERLGRWPDMILTNNHDKESWHPGIQKAIAPVYVSKHMDLMDIVNIYDPNNSLITLHGYLRILPAYIANKYNIINGHPGDIINFPELKGKNPQAKALELGLSTTGVVLHKVTPEVDDGEIVKYANVKIADRELNSLISQLKDLQLDLWCEYLEEVL